MFNDKQSGYEELLAKGNLPSLGYLPQRNYDLFTLSTYPIILETLILFSPGFRLLLLKRTPFALQDATYGTFI